MSRRSMIASMLIFGIILVGIFDYGIYSHALNKPVVAEQECQIAQRFFGSLRADFIHRFGCQQMGQEFCELYNDSLQKHVSVNCYHRKLLDNIAAQLHQCVVNEKQGIQLEQCKFLVDYRFVDSHTNKEYSLVQAYQMSLEYDQQDLTSMLNTITELEFRLANK